jgi:hypothetical protein
MLSSRVPTSTKCAQPAQSIIGSIRASYRLRLILQFTTIRDLPAFGFNPAFETFLHFPYSFLYLPAPFARVYCDPSFFASRIQKVNSPIS